jgi:hypothetical protein
MARNLQFSVRYLTLEDRLLLRGSFPDGAEVRLLLTRRLTRGLLQAIDRMADQLAPANLADPAQQQMVADFTREAAVEQADFSQPYAAGEALPRMAEARLVTGLSLTPKEGERVAVGFRLEQGERLDFTVPASAVWSLAHLIGQQAKTAEWDLARPRPAEADAEAAPRIN